ncbi:hypothetical protein FYU45_23205 [Salmonella enterica subsp. diarizonae]|nr:hypothetical protein [Salmonella enterica subsp. diarizonae]ECQ1027100.1 hypothetical protein [Salmonella enterica subsp. diarizonae]
MVSLKLVIVLILVFRLVVGVRMIGVLDQEKHRRRSVQEKNRIVRKRQATLAITPGQTHTLV